MMCGFVRFSDPPLYKVSISPLELCCCSFVMGPNPKHSWRKEVDNQGSKGKLRRVKTAQLLEKSKNLTFDSSNQHGHLD
jgi:hypothetical protein